MEVDVIRHIQAKGGVSYRFKLDIRTEKAMRKVQEAFKRAFGVCPSYGVLVRAALQDYFASVDGMERKDLDMERGRLFVVAEDSRGMF